MLHFIVMLKDTWVKDYIEYIEDIPMTLCSRLSYRSEINELKHAQNMHALVLDFDSVGFKEINILFKRMDLNPARKIRLCFTCSI